MRNIWTLSLLGVGMCMTAAPIQAKQSEKSALRNLDRCVEVAIDEGSGRERKGLKIFDHEFNCKAMKIARYDRDDNRSRVVYTGRLSHALRFRKDDQVDYRLEVTRTFGREASCYFTLTRNINRGGLAPIPGAIGRMIGKPDWEEDWRGAARDWDGNWEQTADLILSRIAQRKAGSSCVLRW